MLKLSGDYEQEEIPLKVWKFPAGEMYNKEPLKTIRSRLQAEI